MQPIEKTRDRAKGRWREILLRLGIDEKFLRNEHGPCPICGGKDRFRFDDKNGDGDYYCSQCGPGTGFKLLMEAFRWDFPTAAKRVDEVVGSCRACAPSAKDQTDKVAAMRAMVRGSRPLDGTDPASVYLRSRCGDLDLGMLRDLRYHPRLRHADGQHYPALIALMGWDGTRFSGVHRTYLTEDGRKASCSPVRASYGTLGPIRLGDPVDGVLGVAEGIETALCGATGHGLPAAWAAVCAEGLKAFSVPAGVTHLHILGDCDANYTGQAAAFELARRVSSSGIVATVHLPAVPGTDWADVFRPELTDRRAS